MYAIGQGYLRLCLSTVLAYIVTWSSLSDPLLICHIQLKKQQHGNLKALKWNFSNQRVTLLWLNLGSAGQMR